MFVSVHFKHGLINGHYYTSIVFSINLYYNNIINLNGFYMLLLTFKK